MSDHIVDEMPPIVFAKGGKTAIPVFAPLLIVDSVSAEVIAIRMVGPAEAVKANWAMLVGYGFSHDSEGEAGCSTLIASSTPGNHRRHCATPAG